MKLNIYNISKYYKSNSTNFSVKQEDYKHFCNISNYF